MNTRKWGIGNQNDLKLRDLAPQLPLTPELRTVQELLTAIQNFRPGLPFAMLRTTAGHVATFLNTPVERLAIVALVDLGPRFRNYLRQRRYKPNAVRSYSNFLSILLQAAHELGWEPEVPEEWKPILAAVRTRPGCSGIVQYAIQQGKTPSDFSDDDLNAWGQNFLDLGRCYEFMVSLKRKFRRALLESGLAENLPRLNCVSQKPTLYGIPLPSFPTQLRTEVEALLKWKQDVYAEGRRRGTRHRAVTAKHLEGTITRLYGFVKTVEKRKNVNRLLELITKSSVTSFTKWGLNERNLKADAFASSLGLLYAAVKSYPMYKARDFSWFRELISTIQPEPESEKRERKALKYLPYEVLESIPAMIRARRKEVVDPNGRRVAFLVRDELLLWWLLTLVWRQHNIRQCQIGRNIFKAELQPLVDIEIPPWAQERLRTNPHEEFWQFRFREDETKTHREVRSILPRRLVPLLEEYLEHNRPLLLRGSDPTNLFLNRNGHPFTTQELTNLVSNLTLRYKRRRVTPHIVRDIFAFYFLKHHRRDYLTLSKMLWHASIVTTIRIYGSKFDESHALCYVEEWLDRRGGGPECPPQAASEGSVHSAGESHSKPISVRPGPAKGHSVFRKQGYAVLPLLPFGNDD